MVKEGLPSNGAEMRFAPKQETKADFPELTKEQAEELGFESLEQAEAASRKLVEIAKEKDKTKADKLRAELRAMMDDMDGEPMPSNAGLKEELVQKAAQEYARQDVRAAQPVAVTQAEVSPLQQAIYAAEDEYISDNVARRGEIDGIDLLLEDMKRESNPAKLESLRDLLKDQLDRMQSTFNALEKKKMKAAKAAVEGADDELLARAEAVKNIYLEAIASTNEGLIGTAEELAAEKNEGLEFETEVERHARSLFERKQKRQRRLEGEAQSASSDLAKTVPFERGSSSDGEAA